MSWDLSPFQIISPLGPTSNREATERIQVFKVVMIEPIHGPGHGKVNVMARPMSFLVSLYADHSLFLTLTCPPHPFSIFLCSVLCPRMLSPLDHISLGPLTYWLLIGSSQERHFQRIRGKRKRLGISPCFFLLQSNSLAIIVPCFCGSQFPPGDLLFEVLAFIGLWLLFLPLSLGPRKSRW